MNLVEALPVVVWLGALGEVAFAVSGALLAARHRLDIIGFLFMANLTGVGGGTVRDLLLGLPVFWVREPAHILLCSAAAVLTFFGARLLSRASRALAWADAVGIALFAVVGAQKALLSGAAAPVAVVMGIFTACLGGIMRDVVLNDPPILMTREIYVTATLAGASCYALLATVRGVEDMFAIAAGVTAAFVLRALAIARGLTLPSHAGLGG
jgi:uncharacterized membrane protein YeiH